VNDGKKRDLNFPNDGDVQAKKKKPSNEAWVHKIRAREGLNMPKTNTPEYHRLLRREQTNDPQWFQEYRNRDKSYCRAWRDAVKIKDAERRQAAIMAILNEMTPEERQALLEEEAVFHASPHEEEIVEPGEIRCMKRQPEKTSGPAVWVSKEMGRAIHHVKAHHPRSSAGSDGTITVFMFTPEHPSYFLFVPFIVHTQDERTFEPWSHVRWNNTADVPVLSADGSPIAGCTIFKNVACFEPR